MRKFHLHRSSDTIPIIQYEKLQKTNDLRYLLYLEKYEISNLPEYKDYEKLLAAYKALISSFEKLDNEFQLLTIKLQKSYFEYLGDEKKLQKYHKLFDKYLHYLIDNYKNFKYEGKEINDLIEYSKELRKDEYYLNKRVLIFTQLEFEPIFNINLTKILIKLRKNGYTLDKYTDSWNELLVSLEEFGKEKK